MSKYATIEQDNARLKAENERIRESFPDAVRKEVAKQTKTLTEAKRTVGVWLCDYAKHLQPFDETQHRQTLNEAGDVADGRYDWKIKRGRAGISL